jgi:hypothetical protein
VNRDTRRGRRPRKCGAMRSDWDWIRPLRRVPARRSRTSHRAAQRAPTPTPVLDLPVATRGYLKRLQFARRSGPRPATGFETTISVPRRVPRRGHHGGGRSTAPGRSAARDLRRNAGAGFAVIRLSGNLNRELSIAARTRSGDSRTAASPSLMIVNAGGPGECRPRLTPTRIDAVDRECRNARARGLEATPIRVTCAVTARVSSGTDTRAGAPRPRRLGLNPGRVRMTRSLRTP